MGSLTAHVFDGDQEPVSEKKVFCNFPGSFLHLLPTNTTEYTDEDGVAEFDEVPACTVEVFVDGSLQLEVLVAQGEHEDVTVTI